MIKLCVVLPVYNAERYLPACLDSLLNQTFTDFTILAVNDASGDRSGDILDYYASKDSRLKVFHFEQNQGDGAATQFMFEKIKQMPVQYAARMDADDICVLDRFERQITYLDTHPDIDILGGQMLVFDDNDDPNDMTFIHAKAPVDDATIKAHLMSARKNIFGATSMWRQASLPANFRYDVLPTACDYAMWVTCALNGCRFANLAEPLLYYRQHATQSTKKADLMTQATMTILHHFLMRAFPNLDLEESVLLTKLTVEDHLILTTKELQTALQIPNKIRVMNQSQWGENRALVLENLLEALDRVKEISQQSIADYAGK